MFHAIKSDQGSSSTETSFAMDGNVSTLFFSFCQKAFRDVVWWGGTVDELEVKMFNSLVNELFAIVSWLV